MKKLWGGIKYILHKTIGHKKYWCLSCHKQTWHRHLITNGSDDPINLQCRDCGDGRFFNRHINRIKEIREEEKDEDWW